MAFPLLEKPFLHQPYKEHKSLTFMQSGSSRLTKNMVTVFRHLIKRFY